MSTRGYIVKRLVDGKWVYLSAWPGFCTAWDSDAMVAKRFMSHRDAKATAAVLGGSVTKAMRRVVWPRIGA